MRALNLKLRAGVIGTPFRARLSMVSGFAPWENQPALAQLEQFILTDLGAHLLDTARACFGEAATLCCQLHRTLAPEGKGDNVATLLLSMGPAPTSVVVELAYAKTPLESDCFPQTTAFVEGPLGSIEVTPGLELRITTVAGTEALQASPTRYSWADLRYVVVHASIVDCHRDLLGALRGPAPGETTGADNLRTIELVYTAYDSARNQAVVRFER